MRRVIFFLLLSAPSILLAQRSLELGDVYYDFFQYKEAIREYEKAIISERTFKNEVHLLTNLAYCYAYTFQYEKAEEKFAELVKIGDNKPLPDIYLDYGIVLKVQGKYGKAREQFAYYTSLVKVDEYTSSLIASLNWAEKYKDSIRPNTYVGLTNLNIGGQCLGYTYFADGLLYAHPRDTDFSEYTTLYDLQYAAMVDSVTFSERKQEFVGGIKFAFNEGSPSVGEDGEVLYFSATATKLRGGRVRKVGNLEISDDGVNNLKIYSARFVNGQFEGILEMPFNNKQYNCTHPFITKDGSTLYFVSDMPGGYGGLDIYKCIKAPDGTWGKPINMGDKVNTTEHEGYPYLADGYLYFSSKGHMGFGGYDLFQSALGTQGNPLNARNMGKPFNSSKDDMAFIISPDGVTGYLSSNRDNNEGVDKVYYFRDNYAVPTTSSVLAYADKTQQPQNPVIIDKKPIHDKQQAVIEAGKTISTGSFKFNDVSILTQFKVSLDSALLLLKQYPDLKVVIYAHADCRGTDEYNLALSKRRAERAKSYLVSKGFKAKNVAMISFGESKPVVSCEPCNACNDEQHKQNRRVEIKIAQ